MPRGGARSRPLRGGEHQEGGGAPGHGPRHRRPQVQQELHPLERPQPDAGRAPGAGRAQAGGPAQRQLPGGGEVRPDAQICSQEGQLRINS